MNNYILPIVMGYLVGSVPFSYMTGKLLGKIDIRNYGSGNSGSTNVLRTLGKKAGAIAFVGDFLKGFLIMFIIKHMFSMDIALLSSAFGILGHCYPIFLKFKGGKGVATSAGTVIASYPIAAIPLFLTFLIVFKCTKIVSLSSICASLALPLSALVLIKENNFLLYSLAISVFVIYRHRSNIQRLLKGEESKLTTSSRK